MIESVPAAILPHHTAILGKTGSGKTSIGKLFVEWVYDLGHRICIADPIKSDWWGLTSSVDGMSPGIPFQILGGPHGHVPLHDGAGAAIAELVATGALPLSILDMRQFGPGGQVRFFSHFAPRLMDKMKGVLYLFVGEAHMFAPKERSGFGAENMSIHWMKTLATAGRSLGIRLVVETQAVQQLNNRVLGSCENMIAMRLTTPADQKPVKDWLKANAPKDIAEDAAASLSGLATGEGWLCSGEAKLFQRMQFPRIRTFDNSKTPDKDSTAHQVVTAPVDHQQLRALIGEAVAEAEANDVPTLKARIKELEAGAPAAPAKVLTIADVERTSEYMKRITNAERIGYIRGHNDCRNGMIAWMRDFLPLQPGDEPMVLSNMKVVDASLEPAAGKPVPDSAEHRVSRIIAGPGGSDAAKVLAKAASTSEPAPRRLLTALAQNPAGLTRKKLAILADVAEGGSTWREAFARFRREGLVDEEGMLKITPAGLKVLGAFDPMPTGPALRDYWRGRLGPNEKRLRIFDKLVMHYPEAVPAQVVAIAAGVEHGGSSWREHMARLRALELVTGSDQLRAAPELFV